MKRSAGIFLHPTSLPSPFGVGDLGPWAKRFVDILADNGQSWWQVCPLGPTGYGDCPYQVLSSFAGNPLMISPELLRDRGLLTNEELSGLPVLPADHVDFAAARSLKTKFLDMAVARFSDDHEFNEFCENERYWLDDYALFMAIKELRNGAHWNTWEASLKLRFPASLDEMDHAERRRIRRHKFLQFIFQQQWQELRAYANSRGVKIIGDIPYYAAYDSADAWSSPDTFELDDAGNPRRIGGVPPDYFSATGQLWGNPVYAWESMKETGYSWWVNRVRRSLALVDVVRIDHFRGLEAFWAVPAGSETAVNGEWIKGPDIAFFNVLERELGGHLPLIAEDLGVITDQVNALRKNAGLPGMKVLQFAFDGNTDNPYLPYNITSDSVVYTGTHDNDTSLGWFSLLDEKAKAFVCEYIGCTPESFMTEFVRTAYVSNAELCILPMQDVLFLGEGHRMNVPGLADGNWGWRFTEEMLDRERLGMIGRFAKMYGRA